MQATLRSEVAQLQQALWTRLSKTPCLEMAASRPQHPVKRLKFQQLEYQEAYRWTSIF